MAVAAGLTIYELGALAAAGLAALFVASPPGQKATRDAARAAAEALERAKQNLKKPEKDPVPDPIPPLVPDGKQDCPDKGKEKEKEKEKCPVCGRGPNPTPGLKPPYLTTPPRAPKDWETIPPLNEYKRTNKIVHGARVWESQSGMFYHVDTFHKGTSSEVEVYDRKGKHMGAICPHCGFLIPNSKVEGRKLPD